MSFIILVPLACSARNERRISRSYYRDKILQSHKLKITGTTSVLRALLFFLFNSLYFPKINIFELPHSRNYYPLSLLRSSLLKILKAAINANSYPFVTRVKRYNKDAKQNYLKGRQSVVREVTSQDTHARAHNIHRGRGRGNKLEKAISRESGRFQSQSGVFPIRKKKKRKKGKKGTKKSKRRKKRRGTKNQHTTLKNFKGSYANGEKKLTLVSKASMRVFFHFARRATAKSSRPQKWRKVEERSNCKKKKVK